MTQETDKTRISRRLKAVCSMARGSGVLADIGCDHAYVPIALVKKGQFQAAVAADVKKGPLQIAADHIARQKLSGQIETRLSDGFSAFYPGEADTAVIAGMGGRLICKILTDYPAVTASVKELVLEPQSDVEAVRCLLEELSFDIADEDMVEEDGKYYPIIRAVLSEQERGTDIAGGELDRKLAVCFGPVLLQRRHPVLRRFLTLKLEQTRRLAEALREAPASQRAEARRLEIEEEMRLLETALDYYGENHDLQ